MGVIQVNNQLFVEGADLLFLWLVLIIGKIHQVLVVFSNGWIRTASFIRRRSVLLIAKQIDQPHHQHCISLLETGYDLVFRWVVLSIHIQVRPFLLLLSQTILKCHLLVLDRLCRLVVRMFGTYIVSLLLMSGTSQTQRAISRATVKFLLSLLSLSFLGNFFSLLGLELEKLDLLFEIGVGLFGFFY